jgi:hypothetical protein
MKLTIELSPAAAAAVTQHIRTLMAPQIIDGEQKLAPVYKTAEEFLASVLDQIVANLVRQYPTPDLARKLAQIQELEAEVRNASLTRISSDRDVQPDPGPTQREQE